MTTSWAELMSEIESCSACPLRAGCQRVVPGEGAPNAEIMFIGEGPGAEEDRLGRPFVGRAGELLTKMIHAIGLERTDTYICNAVKCRPPGNRVPTAEEMAACRPSALLRDESLKRPAWEDFKAVRDRAQALKEG